MILDVKKPMIAILPRKKRKTRLCDEGGNLETGGRGSSLKRKKVPLCSWSKKKALRELKKSQGSKGDRDLW